MNKIFLFLICLSLSLYSLKSQTTIVAYDFEDYAQDSVWHFRNNSNGWYIGSAVEVNHTDNGERAIYVSNDSGATNAYTLSIVSNSWAYVDIAVPTGYTEYTLEFDWKCHGHCEYDYMRVFVGPPVIPSGTAIPSGAVALVNDLATTSSYSTCFNGCDIAVYDYPYYPAWHHQTYTFSESEYGGQTIRLYLYWCNNGWGGDNTPMAVDNITLTGYTCGSVSNMTIDTTTTTAIALHFTPAQSSDSLWQTGIAMYGSDLEEMTLHTLDTPAYEFTGLSAATRYLIYVRTNRNGEYSAWKFLSEYTDCNTYMNIPMSEDFDSCYEEIYLSCWYRINDYTHIKYPYISNERAYSGQNALKMETPFEYSSAIEDYIFYDSYAVLPKVDTAVHPIQTLSVAFKILKPFTRCGHCEIGIMTDPNDETTFTPVDTIRASAINGTYVWREFESDLGNYTGTGTYIAIHAPNEPYYDAYYFIDDVEVFPTPICSQPLNVAYSALSYNKVTIDWEPQNDESSWEVAVIPAGTDVSLSLYPTVSTHPYTITGLTDATDYDVYVRALCDNNHVSNWSIKKTFKTHCSPTTLIPYAEYFDSGAAGENAALPDCWLKFTNSLTNYPYTSHTYAASGSNSILLYSDGAVYSYLVGRAVNLSFYAAGSLHLTFKILKGTAKSGRLDVGYTTEPDDLSTFSLLKTFYASDYAASETWYLQDIVIEESFNTPVYLTFVAPDFPGAYAKNYVYVDDVSIDYIGDCSNPSNLQISNITASSALVSWTPCVYGAVSYTVAYSLAGMNTWTSISGLTGTETLLSGLSPTTAYDVRVSATCNYSATNYIIDSFTTGMLPIACSNEEIISIGTGYVYSLDIPVNNFYNYSYTQQIFMNTEINMPAGGQLTGIAFQYNSSDSMTAKTDVTVYLAHTTQNTFTSGHSWIPINSANQVYSGTLNCVQGWNYFDFDTPFAYNGTDNLVLIMDDNSGDFDYHTYDLNPHTYNFTTHSVARKTICAPDDYDNPNTATPPTGTVYNYRNNVKFLYCTASTPIACVAPNAFVTAVDDHSATIEWAAGHNETAWDLEYKRSTSSNWTSIGTVTTSPYQISNLTAGSDYLIRIRSNCSPNYSEWVTLAIRVECTAVVTVPYTANFDAPTAENEFLSCWRQGSIRPEYSPHIDSSHSLSGRYALYLSGSFEYYNYVAMPRLDDAIAIDDLSVSFYIYNPSLYEDIFFEVGIMTDPNDYSSFEKTGYVLISTLETWEYVELNTSTYTGSGRYVAFRIPQWVSAYAYIDNIIVQYLSPCAQIDSLTVSNIAAYSADISWTAGSDELIWEYIYGMHDLVNVTTATPIQIFTDSVSLTGLNTMTSYDVYVRARCQNGEYSPWHFLTFHTSCGNVATLPYIENFDNYNISDNTHVLPECWKAPDLYSYDPYISANPIWNSNSLAFMSFESSSAIAVTPPIACDIHALQVSFKLASRYGDETHDGTFDVGVMSNPDDASTFERVATITPVLVNTYIEYIVPFDQTTMTGANRCIAFRHNSTVHYALWNLDDVVVDSIFTCDTPTGLVSTISDSTVTLTWNETGNFEIAYKEASDTEWLVNTVVSGSAITLTGLTPNTVYEWRIRHVCNNSMFSEWVTDTFIIVGIQQHLHSNSISLYPNPTTSYLDVKFSDNIQVSELKVYDVYGKLLQTITVNENPTRINVSSLADGVYFVRAITEDGIANKSFIKR